MTKFDVGRNGFAEVEEQLEVDRRLFFPKANTCVRRSVELVIWLQATEQRPSGAPVTAGHPRVGVQASGFEQVSTLDQSCTVSPTGALTSMSRPRVIALGDSRLPVGQHGASCVFAPRGKADEALAQATCQTKPGNRKMDR